MAGVIWVELLSRHGQVTARHRRTGPALLIGRSYRNDLILDDPAVAPEHLRILQGEDGSLIAEALHGATLVIAGEAHQRSAVDGDTVLQIGHTLLRLRDADYPVPAAALPASAHVVWLVLSALIVVSLAANVLTVWLGETGEAKAAHYVTEIAVVLAVGLVWATLWAFVSRIFANAARFGRHLTLAFGAICVYTFYAMLNDGLAYAFSSPILAKYGVLPLWLILGGLCFLHLRAIAPTHRLLKTAILGTLAAVGIALQLGIQFDTPRNGQQPVIVRSLLPPAFRLAPLKSEDQFFAGALALKQKLERDRDLRTAAP